MRWHIATVRAIAISIAVLLVAAFGFAAEAALRYNGTCGGLFPSLASAQPCTLWDYVYSSVSFVFVILFYEFWYAVLLFAVLVFLGSLAYERFRTRRAARGT